MAFNGLIATAKLSSERVKLLGEFAFPNGGRFLSIGPILIAVRSRKAITLPGDGSEELAEAPSLGDKWLVKEDSK